MSDDLNDDLIGASVYWFNDEGEHYFGIVESIKVDPSLLCIRGDDGEFVRLIPDEVEKAKPRPTTVYE